MSGALESEHDYDLRITPKYYEVCEACEEGCVKPLVKQVIWLGFMVASKGTFQILFPFPDYKRHVCNEKGVSLH
jgi:hypothetical protein